MANGFKVPLPSNANVIKNNFNEVKNMGHKLDRGMLSGGSIIKAARSNIFEFPVFISSSVPLDYATATTSLLEQVYASYLQMAISLSPIVDEETASSGHQFDKFKSDTNKYLECVDTSYQADTCHNVLTIDSDKMGYRIEDGKIIEFSLMSIDDNDARYFNEYLNYEPLSEFNHFFQEADKPDPDPKKNPQYANPAVNINAGKKDKDGKPLPEKLVRDPRYNSLAENERLYYQIKDLEGQVKERDQKEKAREKNSPDGTSQGFVNNQTDLEFRELEARVKQLEHQAEKEYQQREDKIRKAQKRINELDIELKRATKEDEKKRIKAERELAEKKLNDYEEDHKKQQAKIDAETEKIKAEIKNISDKYDLDLKKEKREAEKYEYEKSRRGVAELDAANRGRLRAPQMMDETKIQKLNTMKPLMMVVDMNVETKNGGLHGVQYAVGVKCHNRLVDADILPEMAEYPLKEMDKITRRAKWHAGELKFFKDILFQIKQKKQTAIDSRDPKRKWYRRLYELAHIKGDAPANSLASGKGIIGTFYKGKTTHGVIPNATLVISKSDVDTIKRETKIDMLKGSTAVQFCNELFLMGMVVIDYDAESICTLFPDIHNNYEVHSLAAVNKQISILDTSGAKTREAFKMLG